ncbi:MAG: substrate-binding domain-containing protein [Clostridium sp.]|nr:substrate-binding domain-containing protein [Clostridium sp.]
MKLSGILTAVAAGAVALSAITSCGGSSDKKGQTSTSTSGIATVVCDATFENIMSQEIDVFEFQYRNANIIPYYADERACIDSLLDFKTKLAVITRPLTAKEEKYLKDNKKTVRQSRIAVDAIALIVNPANPVTVLSKKEIAEILSGKFRKWDEIEVMPKGFDSIRVVFDHQGSSTVQFMRDSILGGDELGPNCYAQQSPDGVFQAVARNKNAVGVIGVSWISDDMRNREYTREELAAAVERNDVDSLTFDKSIKVLRVRGNDEVKAYLPYQQYIFDGSYPLYRSIWMINTGAGGTLSHGFYSFVTGFNGQKIIQMTGILPATVRPRMVNVSVAE